MRTFVILTILAVSISFADGSWVDTSFVPPSLGFDNPLTVYLPEGYDPGGSTEYPVIYWLHGWMDHWYSGKTFHASVLDSLISDGQIQPMIFVQPDGYCEPYLGSMWANSELYGNYEDYILEDLVAFIDSSFCTIADPGFRCITGASMGGLGSMDIALRHPEQYMAVAGLAGLLDMLVELSIWAPIIASESPEYEPPYTYDWDNGFYTNACFVTAGGYSPNLNASDSIDFVLDENAELIDSVYTLWELHNPAHMVKLMSPPIDVSIFFGCGTNDGIAGVYASNCSFADTLDALGIDHFFHTDNGGHATTWVRLEAALLFMDSCMYETGIEDAPILSTSIALGSVIPNPFTSATEIQFNIPEATHVSLQVYDVSGRMVRSLLDEELGAGLHSIVLKGEDLTPGLYIFVLRTGADIESKSCVFLR